MHQHSGPSVLTSCREAMRTSAARHEDHYRLRTFVRLVCTLLLILLISCVRESHAAERFRPSDPSFVVLERSARAQGGLRSAVMRSQANGSLRAESAREARELIERARREREPRFFGYAEALIQPWLRERSAVTAELLILQADILQNRHDFNGAVAMLDRAIQARPRDPRAYLQRASVRLVRGEFSAARADCRELIAGGELAIGSVCMAQALSGTGQSDRGEAMIRTLLSAGREFDSPTRAWSLATLADLARRRGADGEAQTLLREALMLQPADDSIRCSLADVLIGGGAYREALAMTTVERPSLALLIRTVIAKHHLGDADAEKSSRQFREMIAIETQRAERVHLREEALYALEVQNAPRAAVALAGENFQVQRELTDIRLLARAGIAARDRATLDKLRGWLAATGYRDTQVDAILRVTNI